MSRRLFELELREFVKTKIETVEQSQVCDDLQG